MTIEPRRAGGYVVRDCVAAEEALAQLRVA
jgi:hypothetical protein